MLKFIRKSILNRKQKVIRRKFPRVDIVLHPDMPNPSLNKVTSLCRSVDMVNSFEPRLSALSDLELKNKTQELKVRIQEKCKEYARELEELQEARISEMATWEGKTLVATLPAYLNALLGRGVHIVTVNDYLARRDRDWMGPIFEFLGLSVGAIQHGLSDEQRKIEYSRDITYGTNNEFGFDYLRDNMKYNLEDLVQRPFYYAIVDEVDSILIDEARTPLIISGPAEEATDKYYTAR